MAKTQLALDERHTDSHQGKPSSSKPVPPDDLWQQLDKVVADVGTIKPPNDSFSLEDFCIRYGVSRGKGQNEIRKLKDAGKIISLGRFGNKTYYQLVKP